MGLFRKMTSLSTLGAVDFKSDKERTATYTKTAAKQAREQTKLMRAQAARGIPIQAPGPQAPASRPSPNQYYTPPRSAPPAPMPHPPPAPAGDLMSQLTKLGEMKLSGLLTDEEFAAAKAQLLGSPS